MTTGCKACDRIQEVTHDRTAECGRHEIAHLQWQHLRSKRLLKQAIVRQRAEQNCEKEQEYELQHD